MAPRSPLLSPREYFERARHDQFVAGLVVFVGYVIAVLAMFVSLFTVIVDQIEHLPEGADRAMTDVVGTTILFSIVVSIIALLTVAALMHYLSGGSETGSFGDAVVVAGWAYAPDLLVLPFRYAYARHEIERRTFDGSDPRVLERQLEAAQSDGTGVIPLLLLVVAVLWSVYILAYGTASTHDVDVGDALLPAAIVGIGAFVLGV